MEKIKSHIYIKDRKEVKPLIIRALRLLYDLELDENPDMDVYNPLTRPRVPHEVVVVVVVVGLILLISLPFRLLPLFPEDGCSPFSVSPSPWINIGILLLAASTHLHKRVRRVCPLVRPFISH